MRPDSDATTHHCTTPKYINPVLLPATDDGDLDALLDTLLQIAQRLLQQRLAQDMIESDEEPQAI